MEYEAPDWVSEEKAEKLRELHEEREKLTERAKRGEELSEERHEINDKITEVLMS